MTNQDWALERMRLRFQLGEIQFYHRDVAVCAYQKRVFDIDGKLEDLELPIAEYEGKVGAYVVLSHPVDETLPLLAKDKGCLRYAPLHYRRAYVQIAGSTFDAYLKSMSSNRRSQLKKKVRKFEKHAGGKIDFREYTTAEELEVFHPLARQVSKHTYQENLFGKGLPTSKEFLEDMKQRSKTGRAVGWLLFDKDGTSPIAYLYGQTDDGVMIYDYVGFIPEHADRSPGIVLQMLILERIFEKQYCEKFDFGEGQSQYKDTFATHSIDCVDLYYFPETVPGYVLAGTQAACLVSSRTIVQTLDRYGLKQKVKTFLRRGLSR